MKEKIRQIKDIFPVNDLITICNVLCRDKAGSFDKIATSLLSCLRDLNVKLFKC